MVPGWTASGLPPEPRSQIVSADHSARGHAAEAAGHDQARRDRTAADARSTGGPTPQSGDRRTACNGARRPAGARLRPRIIPQAPSIALHAQRRSALAWSQQRVAASNAWPWQPLGCIWADHMTRSSLRGQVRAQPNARRIVAPRYQMVAKRLAARSPLAPTLAPCRAASGRRLRPKELRGRKARNSVTFSARARWAASPAAACSISGAIRTSQSITQPNALMLVHGTTKINHRMVEYRARGTVDIKLHRFVDMLPCTSPPSSIGSSGGDRELFGRLAERCVGRRLIAPHPSMQSRVCLRRPAEGPSPPWGDGQPCDQISKQPHLVRCATLRLPGAGGSDRA